MTEKFSDITIAMCPKLFVSSGFHLRFKDHESSWIRVIDKRLTQKRFSGILFYYVGDIVIICKVDMTEQQESLPLAVPLPKATFFFLNKIIQFYQRFSAELSAAATNALNIFLLSSSVRWENSGCH